MEVAVAAAAAVVEVAVVALAVEEAAMAVGAVVVREVATLVVVWGLAMVEAVKVVDLVAEAQEESMVGCMEAEVGEEVGEGVGPRDRAAGRVALANGGAGAAMEATAVWRVGTWAVESLAEVADVAA